MAQRFFMKIMLVILASSYSHVIAEDTPLCSPRMTALQEALQGGDDQQNKETIKAFWDQVKKEGTPLLEPVPDDEDHMYVTFLWENTEERRSLTIGVDTEFTYGDRDRASLGRLDETNVWYRTYKVKADAVFPYSFFIPQGRVPDKTALYSYDYYDDGVVYEFFTDPLARLKFLSGSEEEASYLSGPKAPPEPFLVTRKSTEKGKTDTIKVTSKLLDNTREVSVYTPAGYDPDVGNYPYIVVFDRQAYTYTVQVPTLLDNMIATGVVPPMVAILVGNVDRGNELPPNPDFANFVADELVHAVRKDYAITKDPAKAVLAGASYGGLASTWVGLKRPDVFGNVISQSGSYWWYPDFYDIWDESDDPEHKKKQDDARSEMGWLPRKFVAGEKLATKFYLDVGLWEGSGMVLPNRHFRDILQAKGYSVTYREFTGGHTYLNWRTTFPGALISLLGTQKGQKYLTTGGGE